MECLFIQYPKCGTCRNAKKWLEEHNITFIDRHIVENNPTESELKGWIKESGLPIKKFFNTTGLVYRDLNLKDKLPSMSDEEQIALLSSNGMLIKRPILICNKGVLIGFKEKEWADLLL